MFLSLKCCDCKTIKWFVTIIEITEWFLYGRLLAIGNTVIQVFTHKHAQPHTQSEITILLEYVLHFSKYVRPGG